MAMFYTGRLQDSFNMLQPIKQSALVSRDDSISKYLMHDISM